MLNTQTQTQTTPGPVLPVTKDPMPSALVLETTKAVIETFEKICGDSVSQDDQVTGCQNRIKVVGIISFVGDLMWSLALILPHDSAEGIAKKFAGFDIEFDSADMGDVVGELINVLAGVVCGNLEGAGISSHMSLPTVARGDAFELMLPENLVARRLFFSAGQNDFLVEVTAMKVR